MQLAGKFIPAAEISSASQVLDIYTNNHKPKQEMFIGISTKTLINKLFEVGDITSWKTTVLLCCSYILFWNILLHNSKTSY